MLRLLLTFLLGVSIPTSPAGAAGAPPDLDGAWVLNEKESDDTAERLQGLTILRTEPQSVVKAQRDREIRGMTRQKQVADELHRAHERKLMRKVEDVGDLGQVLNATRLVIDSDGKTVTLTYDSGLVRTLIPRIGGPRYSAKGNEFVETGIGRSMVFWRTRELVIETLLSPRGTLTETLGLSRDGRQLEMKVLIRNPDWLVSPEILRIFDPAGPR